VFSPYYAWSGRSDPLNHCAINVALYGRRHHRWMMTEHGRTHVQRTPETFQVGASVAAWRGDALDITINERCAPIPLPGRGRILVRPEMAPQRALALDSARRHWWAPIAPRCAVEVQFAQPALTWRGAGYLDSNAGAEPLEHGFRHWDWARAHDTDGCIVTYRTTPRSGAALARFQSASSHVPLRPSAQNQEYRPLSDEKRDSTFPESGLDVALHIDGQGAITTREPPPLQRLSPTLWGIPRHTRAQSARVARTLEDAPFYARSELDATLYGHRGPAMHESLDLTRFSSAWVKALLPVRMPRRG
jgi:carotenoid 1,2-hydratase